MKPNEKTGGELEDTLKNYVEVQYKILSLEVVDRLSSMGAVAVSGGVLIIFLILALVFIGAAGAILLSRATDDFAVGFGLVAGFYALLFLLLLALRQQRIKAFAKDRIIRELMKDKIEEP